MVLSFDVLRRTVVGLFVYIQEPIYFKYITLSIKEMLSYWSFMKYIPEGMDLSGCQRRSPLTPLIKGGTSREFTPPYFPPYPLTASQSLSNDHTK